MSKTQNKTEAEACFDHHWVGLLSVRSWACGIISVWGTKRKMTGVCRRFKRAHRGWSRQRGG